MKSPPAGGGGGGLLPILFCAGRLQPKGVHDFFQASGICRVGISLFKVYMKGKMSFRFVKKGPKELPDAFFDCEKVKKTFWCAWYIHVLRTMHLPQSVKRDRRKVLDKVYERRTCSVENGI